MSHTLFRYICMRAGMQMTAQMLSVIVGYQVYQITGSPLWLGFAGLAQFLPKIIFLIPSGTFADKFNRKIIIICAQSLVLFSCLLWIFLISFDLQSGWSILLIVFLYGTGFSFQSPAGTSMLPNIVSKREFPRAAAKLSAVQQTAITLGPVLAGFTIAVNNMFACLVVTIINITTIILAVSLRRDHIKRNVSVDQIPQSPLAGLQYIWRNKGLFGAISLDMFAVLFGGVIALMPVFALDILHVDAIGFGALRAAPAVSGIVMAVYLSRRPIRKNVGKILFLCVGLWGFVTIFFALSTNFLLSFVLLLIMGALDTISVIIRTTYMQITTQDSVRGRVNAVNSVFIAASNQIGEFESGLVASIITTVPAAIFGGIMTILIASVWSLLFPDLRKLNQIS